VNKDPRIFVAGHRGLVSSAIMRRLGDGGFTRRHQGQRSLNEWQPTGPRRLLYGCLLPSNCERGESMSMITGDGLTTW
jgi:hypothetical protein